MKAKHRNYKYYSFFVANPKLGRRIWERVDCKIPAYNVYEAVTIFSFLERSKYKKHHKMEAPKGLYLESFLRSVIEYKKVKRTDLYYTQHQYKKVKEYTIHQILKKCIK